MGTFTVSIEVGKPSARPRFERITNMLVDTGSELTWISGEALRSLKIDVRKKHQPFITPTGQNISRDVGYAILRCGGFETVDEVVFAQPGDLRLLGARTLEGFNAVIDARRKRLVAAGPMPAAEAAPAACEGVNLLREPDAVLDIPRIAARCPAGLARAECQGHTSGSLSEI